MEKARLVIELKEKSIKIVAKTKNKTITKNYFLGKKELQKNAKYLDDNYIAFLMETINNFNKENEIKRCSFNFIVFPIDNVLLTKELSIEGVSYEVPDKELSEIVKNELEVDIDFDISDYEIKYSKLDEVDIGVKVIVALLDKKIINKLMGIEKVLWNVEGIFLSPTLAYESMHNLEVYVDFAFNYTNVVLKGKGFYLSEKKDYGIKNIYDLILNKKISNNEELINKEQIFSEVNNFKYEPSKLEDSINMDLYEDNLNLSNNIKDLFLDIERGIRKVEAVQKIKFTNRFVDFNLQGLYQTKEILFEDVGWSYEEYSSNLLSNAVLNLDYKKTKFNFRKNRLLNINIKPIISSLFYATLTMSIGSIVLAGFLQGKLNKANKSIKDLEEKQVIISQRLDEKEANLLNLNSVEDALIKLEESKRYRERMLNFIPEITPKNIALKEIINDDYKTIIEGYSTDYNTVGYMAMNLEKYGDVYVEKIEKIDETNEEENNLYLFDNKKLNNKFRIIYADGGIDLEKFKEVINSKKEKAKENEGDNDDK